jgi:conjugal transfer pilus assembly protein TraU
MCRIAQEAAILSAVRLALVALLVSLASLAPASAQGVGVCNGKFVNPITDVCWGCLFPLSIGSLKIWPSNRPDTKNPALPICVCPNPVPRIGIAIGFWEPTRLADVTMKPWCFVNLGGLKLDPGFNIGTKGLQGVPATGGMHGQTGDWHVHWYFYPLISWLQLVVDFLCLEFSGIDIAYVTELDPLWQDSELTTILNPESVLFANPIAYAACSADCVASTTKLPIDEMFWCSGCQGVMYPLNGKVSAQYGHVQGSRLAVQRMAFKLHRMGILWGSYGSEGLCSNYPMPIMRKAQYRIQATNPIPMVSGRLACGPLGSHQLLKGGRMLPAVGEDFGYLIWRKRNCCML